MRINKEKGKRGRAAEKDDFRGWGGRSAKF